MASRIFFSAGEASGESYSVALMAAFRAQPDADLTFEAVGGLRVRDAGATLIADSRTWGIMGFYEAFKVAPRVMLAMRVIKAALRSGPPGLFIPIDFGYVNIALARYAKTRGWKVLYFIPPGSWRRDKQGSDLAAVTDAIVTPFDWSATMLNQMGANAHWFGHPIKGLLPTTAETRIETQIAVLPGSRHHEFALNLEVAAPVVRALGLTAEIAVAPSLDPANVAATWSRLGGGPAIITPGNTSGVLRRSQAAIVCSGTATLEAALCGCPTVVIYRGSKMMELEYRIRRPKFKFIALPNILLNRAVVPELIQWDANAERIQGELAAILSEGPARDAQLAAFDELDIILGPSDAIDRTVELGLRLMRN